MSEVREVIQQLIHNPKVAGGVAAMTATMGATVEAAISWIPDDIGKLASVIGILLSVILIKVHLIGLTKSKLELKIMKQKEAERLSAALQREHEGQPLRRELDRETG